MSSSDQEVVALGERLQISLHSEPLRNPEADVEEYVGVFHEWIRQSALGGGLLIDVASYAHVPNGPGVLLIGHEFDYGVRITLGRVELTCRHKRDPGGEGNALKRCLRQLLQAAQLLEGASKLSEAPAFRASDFVFRSNDRLRCPNNAEVGSRVARTVGGLFCKTLGISNLDVASIGPEREPLTLVIKRPAALGESESLAMALRRLNAA
ncbi:MAG TPA: hypothetical protein VJR89_30645 [Polyangiales bacterium]|nr:hypothetical protein [Polyangiales bacterium]